MARFAALLGAYLIVAALPACKDEIDTNAINSLVASKHAYKLKFETREVTAGLKHRARYTVAAPRGWKEDLGTFRPVDTQVFGRSWMKVRTSCEECRLGLADDLSCGGDTCKPQDWGQIIEARIAKDGRQFTRNDMANGRRVLISRGDSVDDVGTVEVYWWSDGGPVYHHCLAWLDEQVVDSAPAFAKACESAIAH